MWGSQIYFKVANLLLLFESKNVKYMIDSYCSQKNNYNIIKMGQPP